MATIGKLSWIKVPYYFAAQYIGAFFGALVTYLVYHESIKAHFGDQLQTLGVNGTAAIFGTLPNPNVSIGTCFLDQVNIIYFFNVTRVEDD